MHAFFPGRYATFPGEATGLGQLFRKCIREDLPMPKCFDWLGRSLIPPPPALLKFPLMSKFGLTVIKSPTPDNFPSFQSPAWQ